jgi:hypothetical protein
MLWYTIIVSCYIFYGFYGGIRMEYIGVAAIAEKWKVSERSVRNYCANGRVEGA